MSKSTPTPGPWEVHETRTYFGVYTPASHQHGSWSKCYIVAQCNKPHDHALPNARLIAAAPALLAACKLALGAFENNDAIDWNVLSDAIALAAPAEGATTHG